jgi:hypothetical protein
METKVRMIGAVIGGVVLPAVSRATLDKFARVEKQYLHLRFSVIGRPIPNDDALVVYRHPLTNTSRPLLTVPSKDIVADLARIRKMNKHRFMRWMQRQPGWKGMVL